MTTLAEVIRAAKPDASTDECEFILWERTPYPMGKLTARSLYKAASGTFRAFNAGRTLCDFCDRVATPERYVCDRCGEALRRSALTQGE